MIQKSIVSFHDYVYTLTMTKLIIVFIVGLVGGVIISNTFDIRISQKTSLSPSPTMLPITITPVEDNTEEKKEVKSMGSILAKLGYPAGGIPPLKVCVYTLPEKVGEYDSPVKCAMTETNQTEIALLEVPVGNYHIFAWPISDEFTLSGSFTPAIACGLKVDCKDHSPLTVVVEVDQSTQVEIKDWYGDGVDYPKKP